MTIPNKQEDLPLLLKVKDVQQILNIARDSTYLLIKTPGFPLVKIGKSLRIPRDLFFQWLDTASQAARQLPGKGTAF